ncbi:MAG: S8 family serine peptidase [Caldilineaceae bacterium]
MTTSSTFANAQSSQWSSSQGGSAQLQSEKRVQVVDQEQQETDAEVEGWLLSRPDDGIGEWQVQKESDKIVTVIADDKTRIDRGVPPVDVWIKVKGLRQSNGSILAVRIRVEDYKVDELVVRLTDNDVLSSTVAARYGLIPVATLLQSGRIYLFRSTSSDSESDHVLEQIHQANDPDIVWAEPNYEGSAPGGNPFKIWGWGGKDPSGYENQFAFEQVNLDLAQQQYKGDGITIAVLDTGVALDHYALKDHLVPGWDMVADDSDPQDEGPGFGWGHGTHVAGIVAHIAPNAHILPIRVLDAAGRGNTFTLAYAIEWAVQQHANVINLSLGTPYNSQVLHDAVSHAIGQGVVIVAAAGNDNRSQVQYPAAYEGVISVSAVDSANHKASFANYGSWIDLSAPGVGITSTITGTQGLGFASWSGTSMATGFVSGAAALVEHKFGTTDPTFVTNRLVETGVHINAAGSVNMGPLLNISAALDLGSGQPTETPTPSATPQPTETHTPHTPTPQVTPSPVATTPESSQTLYLPSVMR